MASSPLADSNCTVAGGVCVFPDATRGERYEAFIVTNDGTTDTFTVVAGSLRPGISPASNGTQGAIVIGTPAQDGTFTFTMHVVNPKRQTAQETFAITVNEPLLLCSPGDIDRPGREFSEWNLDEIFLKTAAT